MSGTSVEAFLQAFDPFIPIVAAGIGAYVIYIVQKQKPISGGLILEEIYSLFTRSQKNRQFLLSFLQIISPRVIMIAGTLVSTEVFVIYEEPNYGSLGVLVTFFVYIIIDNRRREKKFGDRTRDIYLPYILDSGLALSNTQLNFIFSSALLNVYTMINMAGFIVLGGLAYFFPNPIFQSFQVGVISTVMLLIGILSNLSRGAKDFEWVNHKNITNEILKVKKVETTVYFNDKHNNISSHATGTVLSIWPKLIITYKRRGVVWREQIRLSQVVRISFHMEPKLLSNNPENIDEITASSTF